MKRKGMIEIGLIVVLLAGIIIFSLSGLYLTMQELDQNGNRYLVAVARHTSTDIDLEDLEVAFTDLTHEGKKPYSYQWNFGDGLDNSTEQNPTHKYDNPGEYEVTLTVTDANGDVSVYSMGKIKVRNIKKIILFFFPINTVSSIAVVVLGVLLLKKETEVQK
ncbi:MAG: PKD domain-containing protein [Candidatus Nealsonbacteria bacterium]